MTISNYLRFMPLNKTYKVITFFGIAIFLLSLYFYFLDNDVPRFIGVMIGSIITIIGLLSWIKIEKRRPVYLPNIKK